MQIFLRARKSRAPPPAPPQTVNPVPLSRPVPRHRCQTKALLAARKQRERTSRRPSREKALTAKGEHRSGISRDTARKFVPLENDTRKPGVSLPQASKAFVVVHRAAPNHPPPCSSPSHSFRWRRQFPFVRCSIIVKSRCNDFSEAAFFCLHLFFSSFILYVLLYAKHLRTYSERRCNRQRMGFALQVPRESYSVGKDVDIAYFKFVFPFC
ncbi:hypothetical protein MTO96_012028 [Rhipicephalus appendiculatus]